MTDPTPVLVALVVVPTVWIAVVSLWLWYAG